MSRLLLLLLLLFSVKGFSQNVPLETAKLVAVNWYRHYAPVDKQQGNISKTAEYKYRDATNFYIFSFDKGGFVMVSANNQAEPILGYGFEGAVPEKVENPAVKGMFDGYARQIDTIGVLNLKSATINSKWEQLKNNVFLKSGTVPITPLLTTTWDQGWPYNALCPSDAGGSGGHVLIGCVGVAMAQILKYYNYPNQGLGSYGYTWSGYPNTTANFGSTTYNWANMPNSVSTQNNDIATLMYQTAVSCRSMWGSGNTGVSYVSGADPMTRAFVNYFGCAFAPLKYVSKASYSDIDWDNLLQNELRSNRPIYYTGGDHAWVCDGLDASNLYHFNWGWGGLYNGYFALTAITPTGFNFTDYQDAIIGIQPNDGSTLLSNTTWSGSVTKSTGIAVPDAITLTVNAGTVVSFAPDCHLQVWGRILSTGTPDNYALFTATNTTNGWSGIKFDNEYMNFEVMADNAPSSFVYSQIQYAKAGGIYARHANKIIIDHCKFNNNYSGDSGGGVYIAYGAAQITNSEFYQNSAVQYGGGFAIGGNELTTVNIIKGNNIYQNTAGVGGGFALVHASEFSENLIHHNQAFHGGGGYASGGYGVGEIAISNNVLCNNSTIYSNGAGGALYLEQCDIDHSSVRIVNNLIANNTAMSAGAIGIAIGSSPLILNTTITKNYSETNSSIVFTNSTPTFKNCIVYGNSNGNGKEFYFGTGCVPIIDHCDLEGGVNSLGGPGFASYPVSNYTNNINTNPLFVNGSAGAGSGYDGMAANWQLSPASLCINAGDATGMSGFLPATDLAGNPRNNGIIDMGAYEFQPGLLPVSVAIVASVIPVCSGTTVTFTASPANGGTTPGYQWKKNGIVVGSNASTYSYAPDNGDVITCVMTSNLSNVTGNPAFSNAITMTVNNSLPFSLNISATSNPVCSGTAVTFTAYAINGGTTPNYQWKKNGTAVGNNAVTYSYAPVNGDVITCVLSSNTGCETSSPATSNAIAMSVNASLPASVSIMASGNPVSENTGVIFTASAINGGTTPSYQWKKNGTVVGNNEVTYSCTPVNGDVISCAMTSNSTCATGNPATSNAITMLVNASLPASISITASSNPVCENTSVIFTSSTINAGPGPNYQWKKNGTFVGNNFATYSCIPLDGDVITCVLSSDSTYSIGNPVTSNAITISLLAKPVSAGTITGTMTVCQGQNSVTYGVPTVANTTSYLWELPSGATGTSTSNSITVNFGSNAASGNITVIGHNDCGEGAASVLGVTVNPKPVTPVVTLNGVVLHSNAPVGNQWYNHNSIIGSAIAQDYTFTTVGDYTVIVTSNGCASDPSTANVVTGFDPVGFNQSIKVYPIPVTNELIIEAEGNTEKTDFVIVNTSGQVVYTGYLFEKVAVQTTGFAPGLYFIKLKSGKTIGFKKILKL